MKMRIKKLLLILAVIAVNAAMLTACTQPFSKPDLTYRDTTEGGKVPQVSGFIASDNINEELLNLFEPYAEKAYKAAEASENELSVKYSLEKAKSLNPFRPAYKITMSVSNSSNTEYDIVSAEISGMSTISMPNVSESDLDWLESGDDIITSLRLKELGVDMSPAEVFQKPTYQFAIDMFIRLYEDKVGKPVNIENVAIGQANGINYQKALELELLDYYYENEDYEYPDTFSFWEQLNFTEKVLSHIMNDGYGVHSDKITGDDLADIIKLYVDVINLRANNIEGWKTISDFDINAAAEEIELADKKLTRREAAQLIWKINKQLPSFDIKFNDNNLIGTDICDDIWGRRVLSYNFMNYYGDSTIFAPKQSMSYINAITNAETFIYTKSSNMLCSLEYRRSDNDSYLMDKIDIVGQTELISEYLKKWEEKHGKESFEVKEVINDRDYSWHYSQSNTGPYSSVNCMPSIATMAAHWYNQNSKATVKKMRNTSTTTDGWTVFELRNGLTEYNVPFTSDDVSMNNIIHALDNGRIVLAQYSDRPFQYSGHCYVIYGYRQYRDTTIFIINDSDSLRDRSLLYGKPKGCGEELDGDFSLWSIDRFVSEITVIG